MILLDTSVLVYAVGPEHPLWVPCRELMALASDGVVRVTSTVEVVQEFVHVRARRRGRVEAAALGAELAAGLGPLVRPDEGDLAIGLDLFAADHHLGAFDAVLAAAAARRDWALASADRAFASVAGLQALDPASPGFLDAARLAG